MGAGQDTRLAGAFEAIERAFAARSLAELNVVMGDAFAQYGIVHHSVDQMRDSTGALVGIHHFGTANEGWKNRYLTKQHYRHDGMLRDALASPSALWWDRSMRNYKSRGQKTLFGEAGEFGLLDGFTTPVHQIDGSAHVTVLTARDTLELSPADEAALRLLSIYYCSFGLALQRKEAERDKPKAKLTARQRECLQWVRAGKKSWEISTILGVSERTVIFHIEEACRRLGVQTRAQAVIEGLVQGIIEL
ncbi:MAG: autoinducer binding domain-containing protein [Terricaulis sp.]